MSVWDALVGQGAIVDQLKRAAQEPRALTHAWLFTGPPGSGRSVAARAFAAALECETGTGCGACNGCRTVLAGTHPDVRVLATDKVSIPIAEVKELVAQAAAKPTVGRYRVVLVEDSDRMAERTVNVLLKAIEEPAPQTIWLLCAPTARDVLPTIQSRCRTLVMRSPDVGSVTDLLVSEGADPERAAAAARAAQSHVGRARWLAFDPDALRSRSQVFEAMARNRSVPMAVVQAGALAELAKSEAAAAAEQSNAVAKAELNAALGLAEGEAVPLKLRSHVRELEENQKRRDRRGQRDVLHRYFVDLQSLFRDVLLTQLGVVGSLGAGELVNGDSRGSVTLIRMLATALTPGQVLERISAIQLAERRIDQNVTVPLALEALFLALRW
ncbi:MAG: DNA polymerase III subunit delta' [Promicromonosporaceae bacterium]|nr:DNA polymerase III subunit delta' [Promicromonosporaceae bacterium]